MPKKPGDLSTLFEVQVPNLDWLDVDERAYRELERLPKQNLDAVPDLIDAWSTHDKSPNRLVPNLDPKYLPKNKLIQAEAGDQNKLAAAVTRYVREQMMSGWGPDRISSWLREHVREDALPSLAPTLRKLAQEQGLLGSVYVDATVWPNCNQGEGRKIAQLATHAKYVLGNQAKCTGCIHNAKGRCGIFKKELVFDAVPYTDQLVDEYAARLRVDSPVTASKAGPRDRLLNLFRAASAPVTDTALRSVQGAGPQHRREGRAAGLYQPPSANFVSGAERTLYRDLAQKMMAAKGYLAEALKARFAAADSKAIETLRQEEGLLGSVYLRPDQFDSCQQANSFFRRHHTGSEYLLEIPGRCRKCQFYRASSEGGTCGLMGRKVATEIPYTKEMVAAELQRMVAAGQIPSGVANDYLLRASSVPVRDLLREIRTAALEQTAAPAPAEYEGMYEVASLVAPGQMPVAPPAVAPIPSKHRPVVASLYDGLHRGLHGSSLRTALLNRHGQSAVRDATEYLRPIVPLAGLLGNVVLDLRGFESTAAAKQYLKAHAMHPHYILKEGCGCVQCGGPGPIKHAESFPGLQLQPIGLSGLDTINAAYATQTVQAMASKGRLTKALSGELLSKMGSQPPYQILQEAYLAPAPSPSHPYREASPSGLDAMGVAASDLGAQMDHLEAPIVPRGVTAIQAAGLRTRVLRAMNTGLQGGALKRFIRGSFAPEVVSSEAEYLRATLPHQGRLGAHYIDPTPYPTCEEGAKEVAKAAAHYVQEMPKCHGCIYRNAADHCLVYRRDVVSTVPEMPPPAVRTRVEAPLRNPVLEYGVVAAMADLDCGPAPVPGDLEIGYDEAMGDLGDEI